MERTPANVQMATSRSGRLPPLLLVRGAGRGEEWGADHLWFLICAFRFRISDFQFQLSAFHFLFFLISDLRPLPSVPFLLSVFHFLLSPLPLPSLLSSLSSLLTKASPPP